MTIKALGHNYFYRSSS